MDITDTSRDNLEAVADYLGDAAQSLVGLIATFDAAGPEARARRSSLIASRLRLLAETLTPQNGALTHNSNSEAAVQLSEELLALVKMAEDVVQRVAHLGGLPEDKRIRIICQVSRLRLLITILASEIGSGSEIVRFLDFPIES